MAKRGNGEGTIYYSEKLNKWIGQFTAGRKNDGSLNRKSVYGNTRKEVKDKITKALAEIQKNIFIDKNDITIADLGKELIEKKFNSNIISQNTYHRLLDTFHHIENSNIGNIEIQKITTKELQEFINSKTNLANSTISKIYGMLGSIFKEATGKIIMVNPFSDVIKPKSSKKDKGIDALTIEEQKHFVDALEYEKYKNIFLIALHTGMRIGEILALQPEDIDFINNTININKTLTRDVKSKVIMGETTKTYESTRQIPITSILKPILDDCLFNYIPNENNLLFCHPNGNIIAPSTINTAFKKICKNAKIKINTIRIRKGKDKNGNDKYVNLKTSNVNTHMLRHTYATRCIEAGIPAPVLQKLLGHKDISITINTYTTIFNKFKEEALNNYINYIKNI